MNLGWMDRFSIATVHARSLPGRAGDFTSYFFPPLPMILALFHPSSCLVLFLTPSSSPPHFFCFLVRSSSPSVLTKHIYMCIYIYTRCTTQLQFSVQLISEGSNNRDLNRYLKPVVFSHERKKKKNNKKRNFQVMELKV